MAHSIGLWVLLVAAAVCSVAASAQTGCRGTLAQAQSLYIRGAFSEVEATLEPCLQQGRLSEEGEVLAYRLLALSALQQGQLIEAKLVALSLLNIVPDYQADPALDPPSYVELINTVRNQLDVNTPGPVAETDTSRIPPYGVGIQWPSTPRPTAPVAYIPLAPVLTEEPPARGRRAARTELSYWSGMVSFVGDFDRNDALDGYLTSDGPRLGFQAAYAPAPWFVVGMSVEGSYHHKFPAQLDAVSRPVVRTEAIVGLATVDARLRAWPGAVVSPYMSVGVSGIAARMLEEMRYAAGPGVALGLDVAPSRDISLFTEASATFPLPEDAIDQSPRRHGDVFSGFRVGLRSRLGN